MMMVTQRLTNVMVSCNASLIAALRPTNGSFASSFAYVVTTYVGQWMAIVQGTKVLNPIQYAPPS